MPAPGGPDPPSTGRNCRIQTDFSRLWPVATEFAEKPENRANSAKKARIRRLTMAFSVIPGLDHGSRAFDHGFGRLTMALGKAARGAAPSDLRRR